MDPELNTYKIIKGSINFYWRIDNNKSFALRLSEGQGARGVVLALAEVIAGVPQLSDILELHANIFRDEWYQFDIVSQAVGSNPDKTYIELSMDERTIWKGEKDNNSPNKFGGIRFTVAGDHEWFIDDLLIEKINRFSIPEGVLFVDSFDGSKIGEWINLSDETTPEPYMKVDYDLNPMLDLSSITNIIFNLDYTYTPKIMPD